MDYLQEKQVFLQAILSNTQAQTKAIEADDIDGLEALITKRQEIMVQVDVLDKQAGPGGLANTDQQASNKDLLAQIIKIDKANQSLMNKELGNVQDELLKIRTGRKQGQHYGAEYGLYKEEGVFFDTKE